MFKRGLLKYVQYIQFYSAKGKMMHKCPKCGNPMESKGELDDSSLVRKTLFYQCPKCKNIELQDRQYSSELRLEYP